MKTPLLWILGISFYNISITSKNFVFYRLIDLKNTDLSQFYETTENSNVQDTLKNLCTTEEIYLDRLETKNIDFGYSKDTGHQQLLNAVNDAVEGLENIKKHSKLNLEKFKDYGSTQKSLEEIEKAKLDLQSLDSNFEEKFPKFKESLLKEASAKIAKMFDEDDDDD